jgi:hypothetical protein
MNATFVTDYPAPAGRPIDRHLVYHFQGSNKMYSLQEALARDRMRESEQRSREERLARSLAAQRRWHRVSLRARAAAERHARRASEVAFQ